MRIVSAIDTELTVEKITAPAAPEEVVLVGRCSLIGPSAADKIDRPSVGQRVEKTAIPGGIRHDRVVPRHGGYVDGDVVQRDRR